ncbi:MAG TPA: insulinase family protein [Pyrinomonadaceae bacterium]|nr:insulinase family protein [Pyrinomonadaceae bacterium]
MSLIFSAKLLQKLIIFTCLFLIVGTGSSSYGQAPSEPEREQILNGLRILLWPRASDQNVLIKVRIHSGAAFDVAGKAGLMAILADMLFPDPGTREYFVDEMSGRLEVATDHDSLTITMQGRASEFERIIGILRTALINTDLTPENVTRIRDSRIKIVRETTLSPAILADRAIAARLFGDFPYGRPSAGTAESMTRVDRADLLLARERFLNPNNSTMVVVGNLQKPRVMRTLRQLLGLWRKSERIVPATFRQPEPPNARTLIINAPADQSAEIRLAARGVARSSRDHAAATILAIIARKRWEKLAPDLSKTPMFVRNESHVLPGMFVMGASGDSLLAAKALTSAREVLKSLSTTAVLTAELEQSKSEALAEFNKDLQTPDGIARAWLDIDTFGLPAIAEQVQSFNAVTSADLQRLAASLFAENQIASVVLGDSRQLKATLEPSIKVELIGELEKSPPEKREATGTTIPVKKPN